MHINKPKNLKSAGFTLIELLIVIIIIGILAAIGFVAYTGSQNKAKKADAEATLSQIRSKLAEYNAENDKYPKDEAAVVTYLKDNNNTTIGDKLNSETKLIYAGSPSGCETTDDCTGYTLTAKGSLWGKTDGTDDIKLTN